MTERSTYSDSGTGPNASGGSTRNTETHTPLRWNQFSAPWSDERVERLRELWAEGLSASQIGRQLGVTRNAVIGKSSRLGLSGRPKRSNARTTRKSPRRQSNPRGNNQRIRSPKFKPAAEPPREIPKAPESKPCNIMDLDSSRCRWITGDPTEPFEKVYCGGETAAGKSYCAYHGDASRSQRPYGNKQPHGVAT